MLPLIAPANITSGIICSYSRHHHVKINPTAATPSGRSETPLYGILCQQTSWVFLGTPCVTLLRRVPSRVMPLLVSLIWFIVVLIVGIFISSFTKSTWVHTQKKKLRLTTCNIMWGHKIISNNWSFLLVFLRKSPDLISVPPRSLCRYLGQLCTLPRILKLFLLHVVGITT